MAYFILTDSDWLWTDDEGGEFPPIIVEADDEQEAARLAVDKMRAKGDDADGGQFIIARLQSHALVGFEITDAGTIELDPTIFIGDDSKQAPADGDNK